MTMTVQKFTGGNKTLVLKSRHILCG